MYPSYALFNFDLKNFFLFRLQKKEQAKAKKDKEEKEKSKKSKDSKDDKDKDKEKEKKERKRVSTFFSSFSDCNKDKSDFQLFLKIYARKKVWFNLKVILKNYKYLVFHILPQINTANHATFPIQMYVITV